jgi:hypothetical protein
MNELYESFPLVEEKKVGFKYKELSIIPIF